MEMEKQEDKEREEEREVELIRCRRQIEKWWEEIKRGYELAEEMKRGLQEWMERMITEDKKE